MGCISLSQHALEGKETPCRGPCKGLYNICCLRLWPIIKHSSILLDKLTRYIQMCHKPKPADDWIIIFAYQTFCYAYTTPGNSVCIRWIFTPFSSIYLVCAVNEKTPCTPTARLVALMASRWCSLLFLNLKSLRQLLSHKRIQRGTNMTHHHN